MILLMATPGVRVGVGFHT